MVKTMNDICFRQLARSALFGVPTKHSAGGVPIMVEPSASPSMDKMNAEKDLMDTGEVKGFRDIYDNVLGAYFGEFVREYIN